MVFVSEQNFGYIYVNTFYAWLRLEIFMKTLSNDICPPKIAII